MVIILFQREVQMQKLGFLFLIVIRGPTSEPCGTPHFISCVRSVVLPEQGGGTLPRVTRIELITALTNSENEPTDDAGATSQNLA